VGTVNARDSQNLLWNISTVWPVLVVSAIAVTGVLVVSAFAARVVLIVSVIHDAPRPEPDSTRPATALYLVPFATVTERASIEFRGGESIESASPSPRGQRRSIS
jgi:hypothetical protein